MDRALTLDEDRDDHLDGGRIVAWYRVDPTPRILRVLALGAAVMTLGSVVMGAAFAELGHSPVDFTDQRALWIAFGIGGAGLATVLSGGVVCIVGLRRVLAEERYLALRTDGLYLRDGDAREVIPWDDVREVDHEGDALIVERQDGTRWVRTERFAGATAAELAARVKDTRGKALFGLL